jgi:hypothetical protein
MIGSPPGSFSRCDFFITLDNHLMDIVIAVFGLLAFGKNVVNVSQQQH